MINHTKYLSSPDPTSIYNLDGLEHNTFYHVRARFATVTNQRLVNNYHRSRNKAGLSDASNMIYLHTTGEQRAASLGQVLWNLL